MNSQTDNSNPDNVVTWMAEAIARYGEQRVIEEAMAQGYMGDGSLDDAGCVELACLRLLREQNSDDVTEIAQTLISDKLPAGAKLAVDEAPDGRFRIKETMLSADEWLCDNCGLVNINANPRCVVCFEEANEQ